MPRPARTSAAISPAGPAPITATVAADAGIKILLCGLKAYRRNSSTPIVSEARGGASFFFPLTCVRERSAGRRFGNKLTPRERRRVPYDRHARLPALHRGDFLHGHRTSSSDRRELPLTLSGQH